MFDAIWQWNTAAYGLALLLPLLRGRALAQVAFRAWMLSSLVSALALQSIPFRSDLYAHSFLLFALLNMAACVASAREAYQGRGAAPRALSAALQISAWAVGLVVFGWLALSEWGAWPHPVLAAAQWLPPCILGAAFWFSFASWSAWGPDGRGAQHQVFLVAFLGVKWLASLLQVAWMPNHKASVFAAAAVLECVALLAWGVWIEPQSGPARAGAQESN